MFFKSTDDSTHSHVFGASSGKWTCRWWCWAGLTRMETSLRQRPATILSRTTTHSTPLQVLGQLGKPSLPVLSVIHYQAQLCGVTDMQGTAVTGRLVMNSVWEDTLEGEPHGKPPKSVAIARDSRTCSSRHKESTLPSGKWLAKHRLFDFSSRRRLPRLQASASASELSPVSPRFGTPHLMLCLIRTRRLTLTRRLLLARDVYNQGLHGSITTRTSNFTIDTRSCSRSKSSPRAGLGVIRDIVYIRPAYIMRRSKQKQPITYLEHNYHHQSSSVLYQVETPTTLT
ncbi:hypothetical protein GE21DRAFT_1066789 [Neurospora crassa]|nr:hypothetical protein GE21DRAFT_1066789 [Neurospora crassa]